MISANSALIKKKVKNVDVYSFKIVFFIVYSHLLLLSRKFNELKNFLVTYFVRILIFDSNLLFQVNELKKNMLMSCWSHRTVQIRCIH